MELRRVRPGPSCRLALQGHGEQVSPDLALPLVCARGLCLYFIFARFCSCFFFSFSSFFFMFFGGLEISSQRLRTEARKGLVSSGDYPPSRLLAAFPLSSFECLRDAGAAADNIHRGPLGPGSAGFMCSWFTHGARPSRGHPATLSTRCSRSLNRAHSAGPGGGMRLNSSVLVNFGAVMAKEQLLVSGVVANDTCSCDWENRKEVP